MKLFAAFHNFHLKIIKSSMTVFYSVDETTHKAKDAAPSEVAWDKYKQN